MTQFLPPNLLALFAPRDAIPYKPPLGQLTWEKDRTKSPYVGIGQHTHLFEDSKDTPPPTRGELKAEKKQRRIREKAEKRALEIEEEVTAWDPHNDPNANSDAFKTLFVSRINYDTTESKLRREFEAYGKIKKIHMVTNVATGRSRGYAFIEYEKERDMHAAYKSGDGKKIDGRRVLVDVERGRTVKGWKPRRLGGGLGSTRATGDEGGGEQTSRDGERPGSPTRELERDKGTSDRGARTSDRGKEGRDRRDRDRDRPRERDRDRERERPRERDRDRDREKRRRDDRDSNRDRRDRDKDRDRRRDDHKSSRNREDKSSNNQDISEDGRKDEKSRDKDRESRHRHSDRSRDKDRDRRERRRDRDRSDRDRDRESKQESTRGNGVNENYDGSAEGSMPMKTDDRDRNEGKQGDYDNAYGNRDGGGMEEGKDYGSNGYYEGGKQSNPPEEMDFQQQDGNEKFDQSKYEEYEQASNDNY